MHEDEGGQDHFGQNHLDQPNTDYYEEHHGDGDLPWPSAGEPPDVGGGNYKVLEHKTTKRLARSWKTAMAGLMMNMAILMNQVHDKFDFAEWACAPNSSMTEEMENLGYRCQRLNVKTGFDLMNREGRARAHAWATSKEGPDMSWV